MLQHRRAFMLVFLILALVYVYRHSILPRDSEATSWLRQIRQDGDVLNSTLGFEKIFVINMLSRADRRDTMTLAGAVSNLSLTFVEGLTGDSTQSSFSAANGANREPSHSPLAGARGSWRTHMSALQTIVDQSLGSALVLEDDVDWDVRLKTQMGMFAIASRTWLDLEKEKRKVLSRLEDLNTTTTTTPPRQVGGWAGILSSPFSRPRDQQDPSSHAPVMRDPRPDSDRERAMREEFERDTIPLYPSLLPNTRRRNGVNTESPYGDDWDVLWLGHCGADLPMARQDRSSVPLSSAGSSSLKISLPGDVTVPAPKHLKPHPFGLRDKLAAVYPAHTRVVHAANGNVCSLAYAVSQRGARKLLWRFTKEGFVYQWDLMLRDYCMGEYEADEDEEIRGNSGEQGGRRDRGEPELESVSPVCLTVQPPLISHHYAGEGTAGGGGASVSNIRGQGGGFARGKKGTPYIRLSVQENLRRLLSSVPMNGLVDQLPDGGNTLW